MKVTRMKSPIALLLVVVLAALAGFMIYDKMNEPRDGGEVMSDTVNELQNGNIGEAFDEMGNTTPMDKAKDEVNDATGNE